MKYLEIPKYFKIKQHMSKETMRQRGTLKENQKHYELEENKNTCQCLWYVANIVFWGKSVALNTYVRKG